MSARESKTELVMSELDLNSSHSSWCGYKLISDYAVNCKNSNTEPKLRHDTKFIDVKKITQEKVNDF
jgi:hypothetical protein